MSLSGAMATAFFNELAGKTVVWTLTDSDGVATSGGSMPFFSSEQRAKSLIDQIPDYANFEPLSVPIADFQSRWLPGLARDELSVGLNWYGPAATGHNYTPREVAEWLERVSSAQS